MATQTWNLYTGTGAESNRSDSLLMKAVATFNPDYSTTVARLSVTYTITKTSSTGMTNPGTRYGILTKNTEVNNSGQITTRGSLLKASSALATITDLSKGGSITKTVTFDFTKGSSAVTYSGVTFLINDNNTSIDRNVDNTYQWTGQKGSTVSSLPSRFAVISFTVPVGYTNVSNPAASSIKFNSSSTTPLIVTPNASITVSWTAGAAGTNNAIKQYQVTLNGTTKTTTTTSVTFSNLNLGRGRSYKATVKSIPTISGFGPTTGVESTNQVKGNNPPNEPTVTLIGGDTISGIYYIKTGDSVTFSLSSNDTDGHTITYYRNNTNSTSGATAITGTSWETSTGGTYYFWAKDQLGEYSSATSKSFTVGATLTGSMGAATSTTTYSHDNNGTPITYITAGTNTVNLTSGSTGVGEKTYSWSLVCGSDTPSLQSSTSLNTSDSCTWQYPRNYGWGKTYQIKCEVSDQLSQSFTVTSTYTIPSAPTFNTNIYNQLGGTNHDSISTIPTANVTDSVVNNFYQTVVTSLTKDTSISLTFSLTPTAKVVWYSGASDITYRNSGVIPLTISDASRDTSYTLRITATPAWGNNSFYKDYTIKRAGGPKVQIGATIRNFRSDDITLHGTEVEPFTSADLNFSFKLGLTGYNFTEDALKSADAFLVANSAKVRIKEKENTNRATIDGERYIYTQQGGGSANSGLYNWSTNATTLQLNMNSDTNPVSFRIEFTNAFGETFGYTKSGLNFNFVKDPSVSFTIGSNAESTQNDIVVVEEGNTITYTPNVTFYNTDKAVTINTYIYHSTSNNSQTGGDWILYNGTNSTNGVTYTPNRGDSTSSAITYNTPIPSYTIGEISQSRYLFFKIRVTYGSTTIDSEISPTYYVSQRHKQITDLSAGATFINEKFAYSTTLTDRGGGRITSGTSNTAAGLGEVNYGLQFSQTNDFSIIKTQDITPVSNKKYYYINNGVYVEFEGETFAQNVEYYETTYQWLNPSGSLVTSINPIWREESSSGGAASYSGNYINLGSGWSFYNIRAVYQTNIGSVTKTSYSPVETIYSIVPTVSYRKNQIGININNIEESPEVAVAIGATTVEEIDVKYIKLYGANNTATIDLDTGNLENFKVNNNNIMSSNTSSRIFVQSSQPSSGMSTGDIWIDISNLT